MATAALLVAGSPRHRRTRPNGRRGHRRPPNARLTAQDASSAPRARGPLSLYDAARQHLCRRSTGWWGCHVHGLHRFDLGVLWEGNGSTRNMESLPGRIAVCMDQGGWTDIRNGPGLNYRRVGKVSNQTIKEVFEVGLTSQVGLVCKALPGSGSVTTGDPPGCRCAF